ncbi:hypothetical protein HHI36_000395, partial [Cryptolaemus montrouzieri]
METELSKLEKQALERKERLNQLKRKRNTDETDKIRIYFLNQNSEVISQNTK